jgi:hypothetical protein
MIMPNFKFNCPNCKQSLEAPEELLGQQINCPSCKQFLKLPDPEPMEVKAVDMSPTTPQRVRYVKGSLGNMASNNTGGPPYAQQGKPQPSGLAITSLILAVMCISIPAVICGHISRANIRNSRGKLGGAGLAMAGLVLGYIGITVTVGLLGLTFFSYSINNIKRGGHGVIGRRDTTRGMMATISQAIQMYGLSHSELPNTLDDLTIAPSEDVEAPLDKNSLSDSWGQPIQYKKLSKVKYELRSGGPDKQIGTEDDLTN